MPSYEEVLIILRRSDDGLLFLAVLTLLSLFAYTRLANNIAAFRAALRALPAIIPLASGLFNPLLGLLSGLGALVSLPSLAQAVMPILFVALVLRLPLLSQSLWYDEAFTLRMAQLPLAMWPEAVLNDVHPPAFYFLVWLWRQFVGDNHALLRLLPLSFSLLSIVLIYRFALRVFDKRTALIAATLAAGLPAFVYYGSELRSYSLLSCLFIAGGIALVERRRWPLLLCISLMPWFHNFGLLYAGLLAMVAAWYGIYRSHALGALAIGMCVLPLTLAQAEIVGSPDYFPYLSTGALIWPLINMTILVVNNDYVLVTVVPVIAITAWALWHQKAALTRWPGILLVMMLFAIPASSALISALWRSIYVPRTLYASMVLICVLWAALASCSRISNRALGALMVVTMAIFYHDGSSNTRVPYANLIEQHCGDAALYATSIPAAFVINANWSEPLVWEHANDDAGTFTSDDLEVYAFTTSSQPPLGLVCIMQIDQPLTKQSERDYVSALLAEFPGSTTRVNISLWHDLYFHVLSVS